MTYDQIITDIQNKVYYPVYLLMGEEPYFIDVITDMLEEHVLEEAYRDFNSMTVYGRDVDAAALINQAKSYPMSGNYQLLIVKEAQDMQDIEELESYLKNPLESTILVINYKYKKIDARKTFAKLVKSKGVLFESKTLFENSIPQWIIKFLKQKNYSITPKACQMLADNLGTDLHKIRNELEKLTIILSTGATITDEHVERNIGISKDFNVFELQKALSLRDVVKANRIINYFGANSKENPILMSVVLLYIYFTRILKYHYTKDKSRNNLAVVLGVSPFFVSDYQLAAKSYSATKAMEAISILRKYDLKGKGMENQSADDADLYKEMLYKLIHL